jgi:hypothetical protein
MKTKIGSTIKRGLLFFCVVFSVTTLFSSILQLMTGQTSDTNFHIVNRGVIVFIAVLTIMLFSEMKFRFRALNCLVPYAISMGVVFLYVWLTGFVEPLHPNAFRDVFFNFTGVAVVIAVVITLMNALKAKRRRTEGNAEPH